MTQTFLADKDNRYVSWNETRLCGKPSSSFVSKDDRFFSDEGETYSCQFSHKKADEIVKMTHWVKKIKWEWIKNICENKIENYNDFWWDVEIKWDAIHVNIVQ